MNFLDIRVFYALIALLLVFSSCKKEEPDIEKPGISNLKIGENNEAILTAGEAIYIEFDAADNIELANYKINISKSSKGDPPTEEGWDFSKTYNIVSGKTTFKVINQLIIVPDDALSANYDLRITLYDNSGNFSYLNTIVPLVGI